MDSSHATHSWTAEAVQLAVIRATSRHWLSLLGVDEDTADDIVCAVNEAAANSIDHAYLDARHAGSVGLDLVAGPHELHLAVSDQGVWRPPTHRHLAGRGRGIPMMSAMVHSLEIRHTPGETVVDLRHPFVRRPAAG
ncbi:ATP-binding protein [Pseudonocardia xishanensis]|uniref:Histidine kinase/HSP90-like ATPase domain-containing protein n=1 Tax=Pseudonocardia xishanensis TaxID=630995 RepID=A0ABP8RIX7_9PSEU